MSRISDEVYNYLYYQNEPVEFGEIVKNALSGSLSRKETFDILRELQGDDKVFRSIKSGKAYYSIHSEQGESMNPLRKYNAQYSGGLYNPLASLLGSLTQITEEDETEEQDLSTYELSFDFGKEYECAAYTVGIPDACVLNKNSENREFVAWIPDETNPEDENASPCIFMSSENIANDDINTLKTKEEFLAIMKIVLHQSANLLTNIIDATCFHSINFPEDSGIGVCELLFSGCWHANVIAPSENELVILRVQLNNLKLKDRELADQVVTKWLKTFKLKNPKKFLKQLDDVTYMSMPLNQESLMQYDADVTEYLKHIEVARNTNINQVIQNAQESGNKSIDQIKLEIKSELFESADIRAGIYRRIVKTVTSLAEKNPDSPLIADLYTKAISHFIDKEELTVNDEIILVPVNGFEEIKASFKTKEIMKYIEELEQLEKEKMAKIEHQAMLEKKFVELKSAYENAKTESDFQSVVNGLKELFELPEAKNMYEAAESKRHELETKRLTLESLKKASEKLEREKREADEKAKKEMNDWKVKVATIKKNRETENERRLKQYLDEYNLNIERIQNKKEEDINYARKRIEDLKSKIEQNNLELNDLGFFMFGKKNELKQEIKTYTKMIQDATDSISLIEKDIERNLKEAKDKYQQKLNNLDNDLDKEFVIPESPEEIYRKSHMTTREKENEVIKSVIIKILTNKSSLTATELADEIKKDKLCASYGDIMVSRVTAVVTSLVIEGKVKKEIIKRQSRYELT